MHRFKFLALTTAVMMLVSGVGCMVWRTWWLAIACAVVSAYAWSLFFELYKDEIVDAIGHHLDR